VPANTINEFLTNAQVKDMNIAIWEFIKFLAKTNNTSINELLTDMVELYAKQTGKMPILLTFLEEYGQLNNDKLRQEVKNEIDKI